MKRDMELIYKILLFVEDRGSRLFSGSIIIEGYERNHVIDHLYLAVNAGFVELGDETLSHKGVLSLTWKGCDYLDELRKRRG